MKWFKHDSGAHLDAKLQKLRIKYGLEGYGLYFYCLELIAMNIDEHNLTFELEHDSEIIAFNTGLHYERVQEIISAMVSLELFENNNGMITCYKLAARLDQSMTSNPKMRGMIAKLDANKTVKQGYVYFIENINDDGTAKEIKVGRSANPHARFKEHQKKYAEFGFNLNLVGYIKSEDCVSLETEIHRKLKDHEVRKEWFEVNDEVINLLRHDYDLTTSCKIRLDKNRLDKRSNSAPKSKKHSLPSDFEITQAMRDWFSKQSFSIAIERATDDWQDNMLKNTAKYQYTDWTAAWRSAMKKAEQWHQERQPRTPQPTRRKPLPRPEDES